MIASRVSCASALLCAVACSFPAYRTPDGSAPAPTCYDGVRNGLEDDTDCGPGCAPCEECNDHVQNGQETGVDCGGSCAACPTCDDKLQNGSESDVDCGGTCGKRCDPSQRCRENADCGSLVCNATCQPPSCLDEVRNGQETGKDCGGSCPGCPNGSACGANGDCDSGRCQGQVCVAAGCTDQLLNGFETDKDCGGSDCAPCMAGGKCKQLADCDSGVCATNACSAASCSDAVQNQGESAPDCGGPSCAPCADGKSCGAPNDCESTLCQNGTCVPLNPLGQPLNRSKWLLSTSESATESGLSEAIDGLASTCWVSGAFQRSKMHIDVDLGRSEIFFKALLVITTQAHDQDFPGMMDVYISNDGTFGVPSASVMGNQWTWVDFQSAQVGRYVRFELSQPIANRWWSVGEITLYN